MGLRSGNFYTLIYSKGFSKCRFYLICEYQPIRIADNLKKLLLIRTVVQAHPYF